MTITLEIAERLVRNYRHRRGDRGHHRQHRHLPDPANNPDGANYCFYNFASQRQNMTNHCPDAQADPAPATPGAST